MRSTVENTTTLSCSKPEKLDQVLLREHLSKEHGSRSPITMKMPSPKILRKREYQEEKQGPEVLARWKNLTSANQVIDVGDRKRLRTLQRNKGWGRTCEWSRLGKCISEGEEHKCHHDNAEGPTHGELHSFSDTLL